MTPKENEYLEIAHQRATEKKTHVSFPQLQYPVYRDEGSRGTLQWLSGKAMDDGAEGLWRVHNGLYDLNDFVKKHPGGAEWLELTKGTDITEAFECHHLNPSVVTVLEKYYMRDAKTPRNSPFTFNDDGFYRTLKRAVVEELKKVPKDASFQADMITDGLLVTCLITSVLACWSKNFYIATISYIMASLSLGWLSVAAHNYLHKRTNWRMYLFNLGLWSYRDFRISHVLSHHVYPNTLLDLEISNFEPIIIWMPRRDKPMLAKFAFLTEWAFFPFLAILSFTKRFTSNFLRKGYFQEHYHWHDGIGLLLPIWMYLLSGSTLCDVMVTWLWIICTGSLVFVAIGLNAAHHHPNIFSDGDQVRDLTPDWGMHQLEAVMDRTDITGNLFKVLISFGDHALHHLFPTLDHAVLTYLYPVFLEHCEKFRANFRMTSSLDLLIGQMRMTFKTEPNVLEDKE